MALESQLVQDLAVVLGVAALTALLFKRLRLPGLFGFLVAGVLIGPHTPPFALVKDEATLRTLSDLGVVLLLYGLGLTFNFRQLRRVGGVALVVTITQGLLMLWIGYELGALVGWSRLENLFLGATLSISSTTITVKVLQEMGQLQAESSRIMFGVLVLQDIAAVVILVMLSGYARTGTLALEEVARIGAEMSIFLIATILVGLLLVPRFVDYVARHHGPELLLLTALGLGIGYAVLSSLAGFHVGLGAFLMGAVVAEAKQYERVEQVIRPVGDLFTAVFFVAMGTLVDPAAIFANWKFVLLITLVIVLGKLASGAVATFLMGYPSATALGVGAGLAQIGEFSFVIAALAASLQNVVGFTNDLLFPIVVGASALSSLAASLLLRYHTTLARGLAHVAPAPLRTYGRVYVAWMRSLRERSGLAQRARRVKARRAAVLAGLVLAVVLGAGWIFQKPGTAFLADRGFSDPGLSLIYWGLVLAAVIPILYRFFQAVNRWLEAWEIPEAARRGGLGLRRVVKYSLYLLGLILLGLPIMAATAPFLRTPVVAFAWIAMVASAAVILWASISRLHTRIESNVQALLADEHLPLHAPQVVRDLMTTDFPWEIRVHTLELEPRTWAAGKRLGEIELRSATGASLLLVERGGTRQETPGPETLLLPGDRLTLLGTREQLSSAQAVLSKPAPLAPRGTELRLGRLYVSERSHLDGVKLSDAALPARTGLQVVAILRADAAIPNPGAAERLHPGDIILVLGAQEQIAAATALAGARADAPQSPDAAPA